MSPHDVQEVRQLLDEVLAWWDEFADDYEWSDESQPPFVATAQRLKARLP